LEKSPELLESFVKEYGERAFQFAYRLCGNAEESKDLVQEAFYRLLRSWDRYDPSQELDAWFFTIMRNIFRDHCKRFDHRNVVSLDENPSGSDGDGSYADMMPSEEGLILDQLERKEAAGSVRDALAALSFEHRTALTLCDVEGLSYEEISRVTDAPVGTVRSRVSRAREALKCALLHGAEVKG